jgi:succinate dehydrogenase/fumarate reductase-like Fe-S protein
MFRFVQNHPFAEITRLPGHDGYLSGMKPCVKERALVESCDVIESRTSVIGPKVIESMYNAVTK